ncbi:hypothetical protein ACIQBJ_16845 [Kitasatospora sp. NPDC088391]|uniref:hypothetical protein n=1 Tax=Kitasatospora sp. NPDC088391 TaxID=3364074 RepID=UPI00381860B0
MARQFLFPAVRRAAILAAAVGAAFAATALWLQPSSSCPAGGACAPAADVRSVTLADSAYNSWTLDLDIAVLRLKTTLAV